MLLSGAVRHGQRPAHVGSVDERGRRVAGIIPDIASVSTAPATQRAGAAVSTQLYRQTTNHIVVHDWNRRADRAQSGPGGRHDVRGVRSVLDAVLRRQLRDGRLSVVPRRRASLQVVSVARLYVVLCQPGHLYHLQPRVQTNIHPTSHLQHVSLT